MATRKWRGGADPVVQVSSGSIDSLDGTPANNTFHVTIGAFTISQVGDTDVATTAAALVAKLNASVHPYFAQVTWTNPSAGTITGTADEAGDPFVAALTETGAGIGAVTDFADTTACTGPHHVDNALNWSGNALPTTSDVVIIDGGPSLLYGLDAITATVLASADIRQSFTAKVGLEPAQFSTAADGETTVTNAPEYRDAYLELNAPLITVGRHIGPGAPAGSPRLCLEQISTSASRVVIEATSASSINARPAVRFKAATANCGVDVMEAPGGFGVAVEPEETATLGSVVLSGDQANTACYIGAGTTLTTFAQRAGVSELAAAATVTTVRVEGGTLAIAGTGYTITTLTVRGGVVTDTHRNAAAVEWTTIELQGGELRLPDVQPDRTVTTLEVRGGRLVADFVGLSVTAWDVATESPPAVRTGVLEFAAGEA